MLSVSSTLVAHEAEIAHLRAEVSEHDKDENTLRAEIGAWRQRYGKVSTHTSDKVKAGAGRVRVHCSVLMLRGAVSLSLLLFVQLESLHSRHLALHTAQSHEFSSLVMKYDQLKHEHDTAIQTHAMRKMEFTLIAEAQGAQIQGAQEEVGTTQRQERGMCVHVQRSALMSTLSMFILYV